MISRLLSLLVIGTPSEYLYTHRQRYALARGMGRSHHSHGPTLPMGFAPLYPSYPAPLRGRAGRPSLGRKIAGVAGGQQLWGHLLR